MLETDELRARREREWRRRVAAVAAEFGYQQRYPVLVPEDRLGGDLTTLRLAAEILRLRDQLRRVATALEWAQNGTPFQITPLDPQVSYSRKR